MVPYIDVMLVLLIIFMITAPMLAEGIQVDLPEQAAEPIEDSDSEPLVVSVDRDGNLYLDDDEQPMPRAELEEVVRERLREEPAPAVMVRGDRATDYGAVVDAMSLLQQAGAPSVGLVTQDPGDDERG